MSKMEDMIKSIAKGNDIEGWYKIQITKLESELQTLKQALAEREGPLNAEWRHNNGYLICGTIRIARADFDTDPPEEFKTELFDWIVDRLNVPPSPDSIEGEDDE